MHRYSKLALQQIITWFIAIPVRCERKESNIDFGLLQMIVSTFIVSCRLPV